MLFAINPNQVAALCMLLTSITFNQFAHATEPVPSKPEQEHKKTKFEPFYYAGAKLGINRYQDACEAWHTSCEHNDLGLGLFGGYQLNKYLGFEFSYLKLGEASGKYIETGVEQKYAGTMQGFDFSAVASIDIYKRLGAFAKLGTMNWYGENSSHHGTLTSYSWAPMAGTGLTYQFSKAWQARLEYQYFHELGNEKLGSTNSHFTSLGVSYRFGSEKKPIKSKKTRQYSQPVKAQQKAIETPARPTKPVVAPVPARAQPIAAQRVSVQFDFDSDKLKNRHQLDNIIVLLKKYPQASVTLKGYTDSKGSEAYNLELSKRRVTRIEQYLVAQGVSKRQITSDYFGEKHPVIDNLTQEHRDKNRRVEVSTKKFTVYDNQAVKQGAQ